VCPEHHFCFRGQCFYVSVGQSSFQLVPGITQTSSSRNLGHCLSNLNGPTSSASSHRRAFKSTNP
jgi:hypothetical protein